MKVEAGTIDEFFAAAGERGGELRELDEIIREAAPDMGRKLFTGMSITMLGYGEIQYQTKSMKQPMPWPVISIAPQKHYISMYVFDVEDGEYVAEKYKNKLGKVSVGKSCIRFKKINDLDLQATKTMLKKLNDRYVQDCITFGVT